MTETARPASKHGSARAGVPVQSTHLSKNPRPRRSVRDEVPVGAVQGPSAKPGAARGIGSDIQRPLATVVVGGLCLKLVLTLLALPAVVPTGLIATRGGGNKPILIGA